MFSGGFGYGDIRSGRIMSGHIGHGVVVSGSILAPIFPISIAERLLMEFCNNPPWEAVADWLEERGRDEDADWVRRYRCGTTCPK